MEKTLPINRMNFSLESIINVFLIKKFDYRNFDFGFLLFFFYCVLNVLNLEMGQFSHKRNYIPMFYQKMTKSIRKVNIKQTLYQKSRLQCTSLAFQVTIELFICRNRNKQKILIYKTQCMCKNPELLFTSQWHCWTISLTL